MTKNNKQLWVLIGYRYNMEYTYGAPREYREEDKVALFSSEKLARNYIKNAKLKNPTRDRKFKKNSLLSYYDSVDVERYEPDDLPLDPII